jgi:hypothetical protein
MSVKKFGVAISWDNRGFGFAAETNERGDIIEPMTRWYIHCTNIINPSSSRKSPRSVLVGSYLEFERHPLPQPRGPQAVLVRIVPNPKLMTKTPKAENNQPVEAL